MLEKKEEKNEKLSKEHIVCELGWRVFAFFFLKGLIENKSCKFLITETFGKTQSSPSWQGFI